MGAWLAHPWMLAGLGLIAVPIAIHLINRLRFKRVRWAPMEFLLDSQRRNRRRLWLEQLLLLILRCAIVAGLVLIVARPLASGQLASLLGHGQQAEHVILLDDSMSMGQSVDAGSAFDIAAEAATKLVNELRQRPGTQIVTLVRTSRPEAPDLQSTRVDDAVLKQVVSLLEEDRQSSLAASPSDALEVIADLMESKSSSQRALYVISDFQAKDWPSTGPMPALLRRIREGGTTIQLIDVVDHPVDNVGVSNVAARTSSSAVGVPFTVDVTLQSYSSVARQGIVVTPRVDGRPLPARIVESLPPAETSTVSFDVELPTAGIHQVDVSIDEDGLAADNARYLAVDAPESIPVLVVDGSSDRRDSLYLSLALSPGGPAMTGLSTRIRSVEEFKPADLDECRVVYLLNVPRLQPAQREALTAFVRQGGGLGIFVGDQVDVSSYNEEWYADGAGFLPAPLTSQHRSKADPTSEVPDFQPEQHPIFEIFAGERNSFLNTIAIEELMGVDENRLGKESRVIARHRDHSPLVVESTFGRGRVVCFLTTAGDEWTSWPQNPTYVVAMLMLNEYLSSPATELGTYFVGQPWDMVWDLSKYRRDVTLERPAVPGGESFEESLQADVEATSATLSILSTEQPGIYRLQRTRGDGSIERIGRAYNVVPDEGNLSKIGRSELADQLGNLEYDYVAAREFTGEVESSQFEAKDFLIALVALLLLGEQLLAYRLSFHRSAVASPRRGGTR